MPRARVLVVEDQPLAAKDVEATLSVMDYRVVDIVRHGEDAIETAADERPDVVLMDIELAGDLDGIEAAQRIQDEHDVPVVFLTAHAEPETVGRAKQFGPYGYISKPVDAIELRTAIEVATQRRELDEEKERRDVELAAFARTVADHLRDPLRTIERHLGRLEDEEGLSNRGRESLETVRDEASHAMERIEGLLSYAEAGDVEVSEPADADAALDEALENLSELVERSGAEIEREPLGRALVPGEELVRLLENLVENAIEHADVDEPRVEIGAEDEGEEVLLTVSDNGRGIAPGVREHVFDIFHRGDPSDPEGTGVGLAVCKRIAEAAGGGIWVESQPTEGSTFFVRLPSVPDA